MVAVVALAATTTVIWTKHTRQPGVLEKKGNVLETIRQTV